MRPRSPIATRLCLVALVWTSITSSAGPGRLEGYVTDRAGAAASGFSVHLIDEAGHEVESATVGPDGRYSFGLVTPGRYALAVGNPEGQRAPVAAPKFTVDSSHLLRRDLALVATDDETRRHALSVDPSLGSWWSSLTGPAKGWVVLASVVAGWFLYDALTDDDTEPVASPM